ncbi:alternative ribosome rescue aminoacyl-tRNA hydrolase ArfB [Vibrio sagamiensis]|uniref:Aminoacyl-tRNA hydrolase n=1 Tax=Vibrio sagamiensis NBRC 104589 TaxID=1219064 RepID=A0A511QGD7_9VIBR|nr:alternative ribosome rescue aminoacyl-tRNA hydrolase ArfB [Vibrio sagamiensis]PNQ54658.1 aminoacyl-tRNA hydrolase [Vibrio agarivorans]GEM76216.1 aminoacyl-tRNA hydrolase [Vibrio sagamiensis NBRC 104589]
MITLSNSVVIQEWEVQLSAIRAQGNGGQNVNKVSSAIHLRFDIHHSALPESYKQKLLSLSDHRITKDGVIIIKAQQFRTQEQNKEDAIQRLKVLILSATQENKKRIATKPTRSSQRRRLDNKTKKATKKQQRQKVQF